MFIKNFIKLREIPRIKEKFMKADYPLRFIKSVVNEIQKGNVTSNAPKKYAKTRKNIKTSTLLCEKNWFYLEMVPHKAIHEGNAFFPSF